VIVLTPGSTDARICGDEIVISVEGRKLPHHVHDNKEKAKWRLIVTDSATYEFTAVKKKKK